MAITAVKNPSGLKLKFDCGKDEKGNAIRKTKTFSSLRPDATVDDVYNVGVAIASLQDYILIDVAKIDNTSISE